MKITRYKKVQRILGFYRMHFDFKEPYTVLLDGPFCRAALEVNPFIIFLVAVFTETPF